MARASVFLGALLLTMFVVGCGTPHPLPPYETPLAHTRVQNVRTTAYTHTEADHVEYGDRNALGGTLRAAAAINDVPLSARTVAVAPPVPMQLPGDDMQALDQGGFHRPTIRPAANVPVPEGAGYHTPGSVIYTLPAGVPQTEVGRTGGYFINEVPTRGVGSAAADWSRWPAGTVFRIAGTGQVYKVDDYGWALAGRNTIDLYQPTRGTMNAWGVRRVEIEILRWGDPEESLRLLRRHQGYRHIHRMVLELEGHPRAAAALE